MFAFHASAVREPGLGGHWRRCWRVVRWAGLPVCAAAVFGACATDAPPSTGGRIEDRGGTAGSDIGGTPDAPLLVDLGGGNGGRTFQEEHCGADRYAAVRRRTSLLIILDRSNSMSETVGSGDGHAVAKWEAVRGALTEFLTLAGDEVEAAYKLFPADNGAPRFCETLDGCLGPDGRDWGPCVPPRACDDASGRFSPCTSDEDCLAGAPCRPVGVCDVPTYQCFPHASSSCSEAAGRCNARSFECSGRHCDPIDYATPDSDFVPAAEMAATLDQVMADTVPDGLTPLGPALVGALDWATDWARAHPDYLASVLVATDGAPTEWSCEPSSMSEVTRAVSEAHDTVGIRTWVLGVLPPDALLASQAALGDLARAGGAEDAFLISSVDSEDLADQLASALDQFRIELIPCELALPEPRATDLDLDLVNLEVQEPGEDVTTIPQVTNEADCDAEPGWYYGPEDPDLGRPKHVVACPDTCDRLRGSDRVVAQLSLGCVTVVR